MMRVEWEIPKYRCHSTASSTDGQFHPERIPGVACEAYHGPGAQHLAQMSLMRIYEWEKALARRYGEKALAMIDCHAAPLSSWSDTEQGRAEIRSSMEDILKNLHTTAATTSGSNEN